MTYHVPDWDDGSESLTVFNDANFCHIEKGAVHHQQHRLHHYQHHLSRDPAVSSLVPNHDVLEPSRHTGMQGDATIYSTPGVLVRSSVSALDVPLAMSIPGVCEDEMLSWLQYPLEDSMDRNYCSEMFGEHLNPHVQLIKDAFLHQTMEVPESTHMPGGDASEECEQAGLQPLSSSASAICTPRAEIKSDTAMAMGAGRAAGLLSQIGSEVFSGVRTHVSPCAVPKLTVPSSTEPAPDGKSAMDRVATAPAAISSGINFSLFSRPVATTLGNLRFVGAASGPTSIERARQPFVRDPQLPYEPPTGNLNCDVAVSLPYSQQSRAPKDGSVYQGSCSPSSLLCGSAVRVHSDAAELNSHVTAGVYMSENVDGTTEPAEETVSPSCFSGNSSEKMGSHSEKIGSSSERIAQEDAEDNAANAKKPPSGPRAVRRSRAAETHNESEKKRRNKINVKLKVLQSLIPNSNKTDKASVLDEAIEYTKMLQAQVQFMSMKTGMFFPTMLPAGMHYVPVQQVPTFSHMGMGMGLGVGAGMDMGVGMHATDTNAVSMGIGVVNGGMVAASSGATVNLSPRLYQPPSSHVYAGSQLLQTALPSLVHDVSGYLPMACSNEPYKSMLAQQPLQAVAVNMERNADVCNVPLKQRPPQESHVTSAI